MATEQTIPLIFTKRKMLRNGETPTLNYVVETRNGDVFEAVSPYYLCDILFHPDYSDNNDPRTQFIILSQRLRDIAWEYIGDELRVSAYDSKGIYYDNTISGYRPPRSEELSVKNPNSPLMLDGFNPWTAIRSLIDIGYIRLWEKIPTFTDKKKCQDCNQCVFNTVTEDGKPFCKALDYVNAQADYSKNCWWVTNGEALEDYVEVTPDNVMRDMSHKAYYKPCEERTGTYVGFRYETLKDALEGKE